MKKTGKRKLKKFKLYPATSFILLTIFIIILSAILSFFDVQATYNKLDLNNIQLKSTLVVVKNMLSYDGVKYIISNAAINFISFTPLSMMLISLLGISVAVSSGFFDIFIKRNLGEINTKFITFLLLFIATISSLINEVGYAVLIPLGAIFYQAKGRNTLVGIVTAFCGVSFGYGISVFIGSLDISLIPYTQASARLIDPTFHISLTSNLFIIIVLSIILSIIGTFAIENFVTKSLKRKRERKDISYTSEIEIIDYINEEQTKIETNKYEKKGLKYAYISSIIVIFIFIYMLIPNLPFSGILLDMKEKTYVNQLFGLNSYLQDGFTYMVAIFFLIIGIAYGIGAKTIKSDKDIINGSNQYMKNIVEIITIIFFASQFIAVFKETNIGTIITAWGANIISELSWGAIPLIIIILLVGTIADLFITTPTSKWIILAPVVVPKLMQLNVSPQFSQMLLRASDSMANGITPLLAGFAIYIGYLNIYNKDKENPITIKKSISYIMPYFGIISLAWIVLIIGWYITGLPLGPNVYPTI